MKALCSLCVIVFGLVFGFSPHCKAQASQGRILLSLPLTGSAADYGTELRNAYLYFSKQLSLNNEIILVDDKCDPKEAVSTVREALSRYQVTAVVGVPCSGVVLAIAPIVRAHGVPLITFGAMAASISNLSNQVFRVGIRDSRIAATLAPRLVDKKVFALVEQTEFAESTFDQLRSLATTSFAQSPQYFSSKERDFSSLVLKAKGSGADFIFVSSQSAVTLAGLLRALNQINVRIPVVTGVFAESPILRELAPQRSMKVFYARSPTRLSCGEGEQNQRVIELFGEFEGKYGSLKSNDFTLISAAIGVQLLQALMLSMPQSFESLCGPVTFNSFGDLVGMDLSYVELDS